MTTVRNAEAVRANEWHWVDLVEPGENGSVPTVSVVIPARNGQANLDRLLASLRAQTYPTESVEIIVVDDASDPPLEVPSGVELVVQPHQEGFGAGRARNAGAARASGELLLFLDADLLVGHDTLRRFARWWCSHPASVVTATISFFDIDAVGERPLDAAIRDQRLAEVLAPHGSNDQAWRDKHFERTYDLTADDPEMFRVTIGAVMGVPTTLHRSIGGLRELGIRGIEDTEYGYRLHTAGALMVLDRGIDLWHQGRRFFDSGRAADAKRERAMLTNDLIASPRTRVNVDAPCRVPVVVITSDEGVEVSGLRSSRRRDVLIGDGPQTAPVDSSAPVDPAASPFRLHFVRSCEMGAESLDLLLDFVRDAGAGVVRVIDVGGNELATLTSTRARGRASLLGLGGEAADEHVRRAFGERFVMADQIGVSPLGTSARSAERGRRRC